MFPLSTTVLCDQLAMMKKITDRWNDILTQGIPGVDRPTNDEEVEMFLTQLYGEMRSLSDMASSLSEISADTLSRIDAR